MQFFQSIKVQSTGLRRPGLRSLHCHQLLCDLRMVMGHSLTKSLNPLYAKVLLCWDTTADKTQVFPMFAVERGIQGKWAITS